MASGQETPDPTPAQEDVIQRRIREAVAESVATQTHETFQAQENVIQRRIKESIRAYQKRAVVGFLILFVGIGGAIYLDQQHNEEQRKAVKEQSDRQDVAIIRSGDAIAVSGCNRDYNTIDSLRDELERNLLRTDALEKEGVLTPALAKASRENTLEILSRYKLPDCRRADDVLTRNPGEPVASPEPRYPNDPQQKADEKREAKELGQKADVP